MGVLPSFADLAARANPAVVYVETRREAGGRIMGLGTAFVYDPNGLILTNHHVIDRAREINVVFQGDRSLRATVVGRDPKTDIAVLEVEARGLPYLPLGDSDGTRVGDWVLAIGNPFALDHTVSAGIVSGKGRTGEDLEGLGDPSGYYSFIQTDASINPGNSGGPLLDVEGRVVGINTVIRARANNIGFAVPINMVKDLLPQLLRYGVVKRSAIGIHVKALDPEDVTRLTLASREGALVRRVLTGGPADLAGLRVDDVILALDGESTPGPEKLRWKASLAGIGQTVSVRLVRQGRELDVRVKLGELQDAPIEGR